MKKGILLLSLVIFFFIPEAYSEDIELPHVTVFGTAVTKVVPDKMLWNFRIYHLSKPRIYVLCSATAIIP